MGVLSCAGSVPGPQQGEFAGGLQRVSSAVGQESPLAPALLLRVQQASHACAARLVGWMKSKKVGAGKRQQEQGHTAERPSANAWLAVGGSKVGVHVWTAGRNLKTRASRE
jgi:hypothetical protein